MLNMSAKPKILAVDDEIFVLDILEDDLLDAGYDVVRAENADTALSKLEEMQHCDVIVLDRMMPGMDGIALLKALKANPAYKDIPVIMHTADGQPEHLEESKTAGAFYFLIKPYNEKFLISLIESAMTGEEVVVN